MGQYLAITRLFMSCAGLPVGRQLLCSTAFSSRFCAAAFLGVVDFALIPPGVRT